MALPPAKDKPLFTPGPLTTSATVKQAMLRDLGSRDVEFLEVVRRVRTRLLEIAGTSRAAGYEAIPMQGSGTFAIESVVSSVVPADGKLLVAINGAYGERILRMAEVLGIDTVAVRCPEDSPPDPDEIDRALAEDPGVTHVAAVHCETTTGILNPAAAIGEVARRRGRSYVLDSMSAFGAVPVDVAAWGVDYLVSSANKCVEGVPGFAFVIAWRDALEASEGHARTLSLDLLAQWRGLESNGQFRFTPPTHAILAFDRALAELEEEGGVAARGARYAANQRAVADGVRALGFETYLDDSLQGPVITSIRYPDHPRFEFEELYARLNAKGFVIYPGKVSNADCFRIGSIGRLFESDVEALLAAIQTTLAEMGVDLAG